MIRFQGVWKSLAGTEVIKGVDLSVEPGRTTVLIGPSGCGKSTLLRLMLGLLRPDLGRVLFESEPVDVQSVRAMRHRVGYVIQDGGLFPHMTARRNVTLVAALLKWEELGLPWRATRE